MTIETSVELTDAQENFSNDKSTKYSRLERDELLKIYEIVVNEQLSFVQVHEIRISFYSGLITLIGGGVAYGWLTATEWYQFLALLAGAILLFEIARIAPSSVLGPYVFAMDRIATRSKIEDALDLTKPRQIQSPEWWKCESFIDPRHKDTWDDYPSAEKWVAARTNGRYFNTVRQLFRMVKILSIIMILGLGMQLITFLGLI